MRQHLRRLEPYRQTVQHDHPAILLPHADVDAGDVVIVGIAAMRHGFRHHLAGARRSVEYLLGQRRIGAHCLQVGLLGSSQLRHGQLADGADVDRIAGIAGFQRILGNHGSGRADIDRFVRPQHHGKELLVAGRNLQQERINPRSRHKREAAVCIGGDGGRCRIVILGRIGHGDGGICQRHAIRSRAGNDFGDVGLAAAPHTTAQADRYCRNQRGQTPRRAVKFHAALLVCTGARRCENSVYLCRRNIPLACHRCKRICRQLITMS